MSRKLAGIILVALVAVAICVAGCTDIINNIMGTGTGTGTGATATPTPTEPGAATATPTTTVSGGKEPQSVPDLYDWTKVHNWDTKLTIGSNTQDVRTEFSETEYNGVPAYRFKATATSSVGDIVEDMYYDHDGNYLGGFLDDEEISQAEGADMYKDHSWVKTGDEFKLTKTGSESVTTGGKTYQCTVYTAVRNGVTFTFWHTASEPMPVKVHANTMTEELISWG